MFFLLKSSLSERENGNPSTWSLPWLCWDFWKCGWMEYKGLLRPYKRLVTHSLIHSINVHQETSMCQALGTQKWKTQWSLLWSIWRCCGHWNREVCSGQARLVLLKGGAFRSHVMGSGPLREQNCTISLPLTEQNCDGTENIKGFGGWQILFNQDFYK